MLDIEFTTGGVFGSGEPVPMQYYDGTLTVKFDSCSAGTIAYDLPSVGRSEAVSIRRSSRENIKLCEALKYQ